MQSFTGILTVDLAAVQANWRRICCELDLQRTSASAVIKANAYGLGADKVGPALYDAGCREFFVATVDEALDARGYLPGDAIIYVLGGVRRGAEAIFHAHNLIPTLSSIADLRRWNSYCAAVENSLSCAIKINTGMTRLGLDIEELAELFQLRYLKPVLIMSHLACAEESDHPLNMTQLKAFEGVLERFREAMPQVRFSLANSSGIFLGKGWHFDLVRPGASLYGVNPQPGKVSPVASVIQLDLPVLQIRQLQQDASVGYGAGVSMSPPAILAVVAGGYADGLHRTIGRLGVGMIAGQAVPMVGRMSMDMTIFDVSSVDSKWLREDSIQVQVLNHDALTLDVMMSRTDNLGYDVLTSLGARYQRRYVRRGKAE